MRITIFVIVSLALLVSARMRDKTGLEDISPEARAAILAAEEAAAREADDAKLLNALKDPEPRDVQDPKVVASVQVSAQLSTRDGLHRYAATHCPGLRTPSECSGL